MEISANELLFKELDKRLSEVHNWDKILEEVCIFGGVMSGMLKLSDAQEMMLIERLMRYLVSWEQKKIITINYSSKRK